MNIKEIKEMVNLMNENNLMELEIEKEGMRIRLKKTASGQEGYSAGGILLERERVSDNNIRQIEDPVKESPVKTIEIRSPMVGTFYHSPSPESAPFVEVGQEIEPGQLICIIEAMKLMNEIKSEIRGKVLEVLVDNAEPVEFGQPVFLIEPL